VEIRYGARGPAVVRDLDSSSRKVQLDSAIRLQPVDAASSALEKQAERRIGGWIGTIEHLLEISDARAPQIRAGLDSSGCCPKISHAGAEMTKRYGDSHAIGSLRGPAN
jgi:hypothetical protein